MSEAAAFWTAIIGAIFLGIGQITGMILSYRRWRDTNAKLDDNTRKTESVNQKADTIVEQTNGVTVALDKTVEHLSERVMKLEEYNRDSSHRVLDAVHAMQVKIAEIAERKNKPAPPAGQSTPAGSG